jgi:hypothetical protein
MIGKMKRAFLVPSAVVLYGALALSWSCGDEEEPGEGGTTGGSTTGGTTGGTGGTTGGTAGGGDDAGVTCTPGTLEYKAKVVDATTPMTTITGVTVIVLDDKTGQPLVPEVKGVSGAGGNITLTVDKCKPFGVLAKGNEGYTDTYSYHVRIDASGQDDALFRMGGNATSVAVPTLAGYPVLQDRAPAAGAVYWKTPSDPLYDVVGCAHIKLADGTGLKDIPMDWALRYFAGATPSSLAEWPLEKGTRKGDGRFFVGNATPGTTTFVALVDDKEIGRTEMVIFPRSTGSTSVGTEGAKTPANLFLAGIYIDAPAGAKNPTPANCQ